MKWLGFAISILGLYVIYTATIGVRQQTGQMDFGIVVVGIAFGAPIVFLGQWLSSMGERSRQAKLDASSRTALSNALRDTPNQPEHAFALYLRPFDIDMSIVADTEGRNLFSLESYDRVGTDYLEKSLGDALSRTYPLVGIGQDTKDVTGMGRVGLQSDWQNKVSKLIENADMILMVPLTSEGTIWEISEILRTGALKKTVFVMPSQTAKTDESLPEKWALAQEELLNRFDLKLPEYSASGGFIYFPSAASNPRFKPCSTQGDPRAIAKAINRIT